MKTCEYSILTIKENCQWKIWKETALIELCSFFIDILAFEPVKLCPGVGILLHFLTRGPKFCNEKLSPGQGF